MKKLSFIIAIGVLIHMQSFAQTYLPLTGGTLTGALIGTSATFAANVNSGYGSIFTNSHASGYGVLIQNSNNATPSLRILNPSSDLALDVTGINLMVGGTGTFGGALTGTSATFTANVNSGYASTFTNSHASGYGVLIQANNNSNPSLRILNSSSALAFDVTGNTATVSGSTLFGTHDASNTYTFERYASGAPFATLRSGNSDNNVPAGFNFQTRISDGTAIDAVTISGAGDVGIGTTTPDSKLTVAGKIHSREVKVTPTAGADFVFEDDYKLRSLAETAAFIKINKHLPEIASAETMKREGIEIGELSIKLLQKIEELTLYVIELKKENELQQLQLDQIRQKNRSRVRL